MRYKGGVASETIRGGVAKAVPSVRTNVEQKILLIRRLRAHHKQVVQGLLNKYGARVVGVTMHRR